MSIITIDFGLFFWMFLSFLIVFFILKKYAWKPILGVLLKREEYIENALNAAEKAKQEMEKLEAENELIIQKAKEERDKLFKEAREIKDQIIHDAKRKAASESNKMIEAARENIESEKLAALQEIKQQVVSLSIEIAEKILRSELSEKSKQDDFIGKLIDETSIN